VPLHAAYTIAKIAISRIGKNQDKITGKRAREGEEEGGVQKSEYGSSGVQEFGKSKEQFFGLSRHFFIT
jgi:hypothetical protein